MTTDSKYDPDCDYCVRNFETHVYHECEICIVIECDDCGDPLVIWKNHDIIPPSKELDHMFNAAWTSTGGFDQKGQFDAVRTRKFRHHWHGHIRAQGRLSHA